MSINVPERIKEFKQRLQNLAQQEADSLRQDTGLLVKSINIPFEVINVTTHSNPRDEYRVRVEYVEVGIDL